MDDLHGTPRPEFSRIHQARSHTRDAAGTGRRERPEPWLYMALLVALAGLAGAISAAALLIPESRGYATVAGVPVEMGLDAAPLLSGTQAPFLCLLTMRGADS